MVESESACVFLEQSASDIFDIAITPVCTYGDSPMRLICGETLMKVGVHSFGGSSAITASEAMLPCKGNVHCAQLLKVREALKVNQCAYARMQNSTAIVSSCADWIHQGHRRNGLYPLSTPAGLITTHCHNALPEPTHSKATNATCAGGAGWQMILR